jgi:hypothetical protein
VVGQAHATKCFAGISMSGSNRSKKLLMPVGIVTLALVISAVYLVHYYGETRPTVAQPGAARTHAARIHNRTVYLTSGEYALAFASHAVAIVAIGVFVGALLRSRVKKKGVEARS